jgi:hypothetical protein
MATVVAICNFGVFYSLPLWFLAVDGTSIHAAGGELFQHLLRSAHSIFLEQLISSPSLLAT